VFRSREWPQYFEIGLDNAFYNLFNDGSTEENRRYYAPLLYAEINNKVLDSTQTGKSDFQSNENVLILDPFESNDIKDRNMFEQEEDSLTTRDGYSAFDDSR